MMMLSPARNGILGQSKRRQSVQYTVRSRGRPIGVTDLGFVCTHVHYRMGWFYPNEYAKRVMPHISAVLPALRASLGTYDGVSFTLDPGILNAENPAEEAIRRVTALELTLHRPDGSRVPTEDIGIQDVEQLLALPETDLEEFGEDDWEWYDELDDEDDPFDLNTDLDEMLASPRIDAVEAWEPERESEADENVEFQQFQIQVRLKTPLDDNPVIADEEWWRKHDKW
jgi:hypothetical protein